MPRTGSGAGGTLKGALRKEEEAPDLILPHTEGPQEEAAAPARSRRFCFTRQSALEWEEGGEEARLQLPSSCRTRSIPKDHGSPVPRLQRESRSCACPPRSQPPFSSSTSCLPACLGGGAATAPSTTVPSLSAGLCGREIPSSMLGVPGWGRATCQPLGSTVWVGRRARTPGAETWAQPAPPPWLRRGWLTAPGSFQRVRRRKQQRTPAFFPFSQLCPKGAAPARFPVCSVAAAGLAAAPRSRPRVQQAGASAALPLRAARPGLFPGGISSRRARGLLCVLAWPRGSGKDERPSLASSACQHSALGRCCKAHAKPKGLRGGARVVLSIQPRSLLASSPRQIGSHK